MHQGLVQMPITIKYSLRACGSEEEVVIRFAEFVMNASVSAPGEEVLESVCEPWLLPMTEDCCG